MTLSSLYITALILSHIVLTVYVVRISWSVGPVRSEEYTHPYTRKMVPITGRARSFLLVFKNKIKRGGGRGDRIKTTGLSIYPML